MEQISYTAILKNHPRRIEARYLWRHLAGDLAIWLAMSALVTGAWWGKVFAAALFAAFTFRAFAVMHDCVHSAAASRRQVNVWVGEAYGIFCLLPFGSWRRLHLEHHTWTGNVERDPSMKIIAQFQRAKFKVSPSVTFCWRFWLPLLGYLQHRVFWQATLSQREFVFLLGAVAYLAGALWLLGPLVVGGGAVLYLYLVEVINFPHHLGLRQFGGESRFAVSQQQRFVRSCHYPRWLAHHVFLNFNLHTEHHLFPAHPWYQLDVLHGELLKVCPEANRCVGNEWILRNRSRSIEAVLAESFAPAERDDQRAS